MEATWICWNQKRHKQMERCLMFLDGEKQHHWSVHSTQSYLQIQYTSHQNTKGILHRYKKNNPKICVSIVCNDIPCCKSIHVFICCWLNCMCAWSLSHVWISATLWTAARQAPLSLGILQQESWNGLLCPPPVALPNCRIELRSPALQADSLLTELPGKSIEPHKCINCFSSSLGMFWPQLLQLSFSTLFSPLLLVHMLI